jgi:hypothetical protein
MVHLSRVIPLTAQQDCAGSQVFSNSAPPACTHSCRIQTQAYPTTDEVLNPGNSAFLFFQVRHLTICAYADSYQAGEYYGTQGEGSKEYDC